MSLQSLIESNRLSASGAPMHRFDVVYSITKNGREFAGSLSIWAFTKQQAQEMAEVDPRLPEGASIYTGDMS